MLRLESNDHEGGSLPENLFSPRFNIANCVFICRIGGKGPDNEFFRRFNVTSPVKLRKLAWLEGSSRLL